MSKNFEVKKEVVADIIHKLQNAKSVVVVNYSGLTVEQVTELRNQCRAAQVEYCVLKNTLVRRALDDLGITALDHVLAGPSAFAFGMADAVSPAKVIDGFINKTKTTALEVKAGLLGRNALNANEVHALAELPSREVLLARLLGCMTNSVAGFVRVLEAVRKQKAGETE
jgi:large subunit ribosomal protein L10